MPATRSSNHVGPSRKTQQRRTTRLIRRQTSDASSVAESQPPPPPSRPRRGKNPLSNRRLSAVADEALTTHRRRSSSLSASTSRKPYIRKSLTGAEEMTVQQRAETLSRVASDCLFRFLRGDAWEKAWENVKSIRTTYLFEANSPPFPLLADVLSHLHTQTRAKVDRIVLTRALELSNQATFVYTILRPDEAVSLYPDHGRGDGNDNLEKRDAILRAAWKAFWIVIVRSAEGTSRSALRLWLDFATQIHLLYRCPTVIPPSLPDKTAQAPDTSQLFNEEAISRWGLNSLLDDDESYMVELEREWKDLAHGRWEELSRTSTTILMKRYPYNIFQREMLAYIQNEIAFVPDDPRRQSDRIRDPNDLTTNENASDDELDLEATDDLEELEATSDDSNPDDDEESNIDTLPVNVDTFAEIAAEMEREQTRSQTRSPRKRPRSARPEDQPDSGWAIRDRRSVTPRPPIQNAVVPQFNFAAYQADAVRVTWDETQTQSQQNTPPGPSTPKVRQESRFAPSSAALPSPLQHMGRTPGRTPARTPGRTPFAGPTPSSSRMQQFLSADRGVPRTLFAPGSPTVSGRSAQSTPIPSFTQRLRVTSATPAGQRFRPRSPSPEDFGDILPDTQQLNGGVRFGTLGQAESTTGLLFGQPVEHRVVNGLGLGTHHETEAEEFGRSLGTGASSRQGRTRLGPSTDETDHPQEFGVLGDFSQQADEDGPGHGLGVGISDHGSLTSPGTQGPGDHDRQSTVEDDAPQGGLDASEVDPTPPIPVASSARPARPTWKAFTASSRDIADPEAFSSPNSADEEEDRQLLRTPSRHVTIQAPSTRERKPSPGFLVPVGPFRPHSVLADIPGQSNSRGRKFKPLDDDPYIVDEDGNPLEEDANYMIPRDTEIVKSELHGKVNGHVSLYIRKAGKRKWTAAEELLLYRTVQKVPMEEPYPLRVVWHLHGEHGTLSNQLEDFNPQHMKDKMRVIAQTRINNHRVVEGRARFFLPTDHPDKIAFAAEMDRVAKKVNEENKKRARDEFEEAAHQAAKKKVSRRTKKTTKATATGTKGRRKGARITAAERSTHPDKEDELEDDADEEALDVVDEEETDQDSDFQPGDKASTAKQSDDAPPSTGSRSRVKKYVSPIIRARKTGNKNTPNPKALTPVIELPTRQTRSAAAITTPGTSRVMRRSGPDATDAEVLGLRQGEQQGEDHIEVTESDLDEIATDDEGQAVESNNPVEQDEVAETTKRQAMIAMKIASNRQNLRKRVP